MTLYDGNIWTNKSATLSDKSARKEYQLTQDEILEGINNGKLQFKVNYIYDNPWYRLLRAEVEKFVEEKYGSNKLQLIKSKRELLEIEKELKIIAIRAKVLEMRRLDMKATISTLSMKIE
ncbi:MAG: hypothetical protein KKA07_16885 [Bacteroidetes bacterium]|nr:hypothetical protein [Bacteroidota bacterium]MBU1720744.1 hypothetical protein [Bacteroidota bacterium]